MARKRKKSPFALGKIQPINTSLANIPPINIGGTGSGVPADWREQLESIKDNEETPFDALIGAGKIGLDVLSAGGRAVGGIISEAQDDGFQLVDIPKGITKLADDDYDPSDVLKADGFWESLALDVALDPLTYASLGLVGAGKAGVLGASKGASKLIKAGDKAGDGAKAGKKASETGVFSRATRQAEDKLADEKAILYQAETKLDDLKLKKAKAPKGKKDRDNFRKDAESKELRSLELKQRAKDQQNLISPDIQAPLRMRLDDLENNLIPAARETAAGAGVVAKQVASKQADEAISAVRPGGQASNEIAKQQARLQKEIAKKETARNNLKRGTPERDAANKELLDLRNTNKQLEKDLRLSTNSNKLRQSVKKETEASDVAKFADEVIERASTDTLSGAKIFDPENIAKAIVVPATATLKGSKQQAARAIDDVTRLEDEAQSLRRQLTTADDEAVITQQIDEGLQEADALAGQAQNLRNLADTDVTQLKDEISQAADQVGKSREVVATLEQQLELLRNSKTVDEAAGIQQKIMETIDQPAMRDIAPDIVQRKLMFAPMGIRLPGGLSEKIAIPLGRAYSKSARRAAFDERFPGLAAVRNLIGETFDPIYKISPILADLERGRSNLARADADKFIAKAQDYRNLTTQEERSIINDLLVQADELDLDLSSAASREAALQGKDIIRAREIAAEAIRLNNENPVDLAKQALDNASRGSRAAANDNLKNARLNQKRADEAEKLLMEAEEASAARAEIIEKFETLSDVGKEAAEFVLQTYRKDAEIDFALGFIKTIREGYSARLRPLKGDAQQVMRVNEAAIYQEKGFAKARKGGTPDEEIDFLEAFSLRQIQAAQMRQGYGMVNSLSNEVGRVFRSADEAKEAGFIKPDKGKAGEWLGDDVYIPKEIADSLDRVQEIWSSPRTINAFTRKWSILNGMFKNVAYTINPGHFLIDSIGDTWNMWLARVPIFDPRYMSSSIRIAKEVESYEKAILRGEVPKKTTVNLGKGRTIDLQELVLTLDAKGLRNRGRSAGRSGLLDNEAGDWLLGDPRRLGKLNPRRVARGTSSLMQRGGNLRDNTFRSYGFIAQMQKNLDDGMELNLALNAAGNTIRFSTFDYNDLTSVEKRIFRNVMPFYTWTRKNIPYQLNRLMATPGRVTLPFKAQEASFQQEGAPDLSLMQPFTRDTNFLLPKALSGLMPGMENASLFVNPMIPSMDLGRFQTFRSEGDTGPIPGFDITEPIGMLSPYIKAIPELGMNREFFSGREIGSAPSYVLRTFLGQPGGQVVKQLSPDSPGYKTVEVGPLDMRLNQILGLTGQLGGFRGYALEEQPAMAARAARLQAIQMRKSMREEQRRTAGNLFSLPLIGVDVPNPFYY